MSYLWHTFLYDPILNALIALYNGPAGQNLGLALIELTVVVRVFLLPFTGLALRARRRYEALWPEVQALEQSHKNDPVRRSEAIRQLLRSHHIRPWAKAFMFGLQFLVLIILYRVFVDAVRHNDFTGLYSWNEKPDFLDRNFLGFDLAAHSVIWAGVVGWLLYLDLWLEDRKSPAKITNRDVIYRVAFPSASFLILYVLPSGKSVFVLTSIIFSLMIDGVIHIFRTKRQPN
ncbi:YidC/Oxa1 family membrane protein insertase [Candidatus Uhrbacteria bacterium]|nr:YidC/Oxa1 family membrane protein insertase [Candidatus Uhrbacteria bacterium]